MQTLFNHLKLLFALLVVACSEPVTSESADYRIGERLPAVTLAAAASKAPVSPAQYREIDWYELVPPGWDPAKVFEKLNLDNLQDADPRAEEALTQMRKAWDDAPVNASLNGQAVRIPGFVVPLDAGSAKLREFLLVPYFGGCIHVPPPPANQIIHVRATVPLDNIKAMDAVWVNGILTATRSNSQMGHAGYKMEAWKVENYQWGK